MYESICVANYIEIFVTIRPHIRGIVVSPLLSYTQTSRLHRLNLLAGHRTSSKLKTHLTSGAAAFHRQREKRYIEYISEGMSVGHTRSNNFNVKTCHSGGNRTAIYILLPGLLFDTSPPSFNYLKKVALVSHKRNVFLDIFEFRCGKTSILLIITRRHRATFFPKKKQLRREKIIATLYPKIKAISETYTGCWLNQNAVVIVNLDEDFLLFCTRELTPKAQDKLNSSFY